jgi:hypothetical protein
MNNPANKRNAAPSTTEPVSAKVSVLVVGSPVLSRIITHLFASGPNFEVVGSFRGLKSLAPEAARLLPKLIVAGGRPVGSGLDATVRTIRRASPLSKVILLCARQRFSEQRQPFRSRRLPGPGEVDRATYPNSHQAVGFREFLKK